MPQPLTAAVRYLSGEREPVRVATTENIVLQGLMTIDDVEVEVGDRVLVKDQTDKRQNGIYLASEGVWFRAPDASYARAIDSGVTVRVQEGTASNGKDYRFTKKSPQLGTDEILLEAIFVAFEEALQAAVTDAQNAAADAVAAKEYLEDAVDNGFNVDLIANKNIRLGGDANTSALKLGSVGQAIGRTAVGVYQDFYNPEGVAEDGTGGWRWLTSEGVVASLSKAGRFNADSLTAARRGDLSFPGTYGAYGNAAAAWVKANWKQGVLGGNRPAVLGFSSDSEIATYFNRDHVGLYVENVAKQATVVNNCVFTATRVTLGNALGPNPTVLKKGMIIDTGHTPQKYSGFVTGWDVASGQWIDVSGWFLVTNESGSLPGNSAAGQVPSGPMSIIINPQTKTWVINANTYTDGASQSGQATLGEMGLFNNKDAFSYASLESGDNSKNHDGIDVVSLGSYRTGWGFMARSAFSKMWVGFEAFGMEYAGFVDSNNRLAAGNESKWGFLAQSGANNAFGVMSRTQVPLGRWDGASGLLQVGTIGPNQGHKRDGTLISGTRNGVQISGGAAGSPGAISAFGVDTDINLLLSPKGAGVISLGASTSKLSFFGGANATRQTVNGAKAGNAALASLIAALAAYGIITDATS